MNFCNIKYFDIANGEGVRTTLFVSGCTNHCENCFQPETWDFAYGKEFTEETERQIIDSLAPYYVNGLTLLGGEPFEPKNQPRLLELLRKVRAEHPEKDVWCFTGFTLDGELLKDGSYPRCDVTDEMLSLIDVLVDGRYVEALKDISLRFRGSSNQRIIDMNKTREAGKIVLWNEKQL
ncbi:MAG: anaerobic ribonucleoside-triphosphate reductase activating protein [Clostridia bacterium]|nr:anaerobic ribonucleoside-triphosphate reductase activating protein [Clostridia bacterium]